MTLKNISIINYKNLADVSLSLSPKINCFIGSNGEGKTNLLDAIYYLSFCKSMTTNVDSNVIRHEADFFIIQGEYENESGMAEEVYAGMKRGVKKQFKRNKKAYKRLSEHIGLIPLIIVSPDDTSIIRGGSEERRRMLDIVIAQFDATYIDALNNYNKALQQRNVLLKMEEEPDITLLELWEEEMARYGEVIYQKRDAFVKDFIPVFQNIYRTISGDKEEVTLEYVSHCQRGSLLNVIQRDRMKDRAVGYSLHGIHKDELEMKLDGYPVRKEGSQGQNKTFLTSLMLAQYRLLADACGRKPLLLLDDVFDRLDSVRVERILRLVQDSERFGQVFITDVDRNHIGGILDSIGTPYRLFTVENGSVV